MTILKDVLYDPDPDGQTSGGSSSDGSTPPPEGIVTGDGLVVEQNDAPEPAS